jgi:hypothetical protein
MLAIFRAALALALFGLAAAAFSAEPDVITPDGGRYYGPLVGGKLHGEGRIEWDSGAFYQGDFVKGAMSGFGRIRFANGAVYSGEVKNGMMSGHGRFEIPGREVYDGEFRQDLYWGKGEILHRDGGIYRGAFERGDYHGKGRYEAPNGEVYDGDFREGEFTGRGRYAGADGTRYEGEFTKWRFHGQGRYSAGGTTYEGTFVDGVLNGPGKSTGPLGTYEGQFHRWQFHGTGVLRLPNGDVYRGGFENGLYAGEGTLTYAKPRPDGRTQESGTWRFGMLPRDDERRQMKADVEAALYSQKELLDKALASLQARDPGRINLYLLTVAGDGSQEVFRREVEFVQDEFARRFRTAGRSVALVNSRSTVTSAPMATVTSIREALTAIAARMDREEDILFLFLTSHGSSEHELTLAQNGMQLPGLPAKTLGELLKQSGIRWKVVVVSACYSGGFIDSLQDPHTLVITAARRDRRSFGCADENDFTRFGRAFFKESLPKSSSFHEAFRKAQTLVGEWELKDTGTEEKRSLPQISTGAAIEAHLHRWWTQK